jgi:hypothetical protein
MELLPRLDTVLTGGLDPLTEGSSKVESEVSGVKEGPLLWGQEQTKRWEMILKVDEMAGGVSMMNAF